MNNEKRVLLETRLRNLKRRYARIVQHPDLTDMAVELKTEIENVKNQLR